MAAISPNTLKTEVYTDSVDCGITIIMIIVLVVIRLLLKILAQWEEHIIQITYTKLYKHEKLTRQLLNSHLTFQLRPIINSHNTSAVEC